MSFTCVFRLALPEVSPCPDEIEVDKSSELSPAGALSPHFPFRLKELCANSQTFLSNRLLIEKSVGTHTIITCCAVLPKYATKAHDCMNFKQLLYKRTIRPHTNGVVA
jgi:hypothetical protein